MGTGKVFTSVMSGDDWKRCDSSERLYRAERESRIIRDFIAEVERRAVHKMLKTAKLEGAHSAAMKQLLAEYPKEP